MKRVYSLKVRHEPTLAELRKKIDRLIALHGEKTPVAGWDHDYDEKRRQYSKIILEVEVGI